MTRTIVPIFLILVLTACQERHTITMPENNTIITNEISETTSQSNVLMKAKAVVKDEIKTREDQTASITEPNIAIEEKIIPMKAEKVEETIPAPKIKKSVPVKVETKSHKDQEIFSGGMMTDGLDIGTIRLGKEGDTTRLVLDSYKWNADAKTPSVRAHESGYYTLTFEPKIKRITAILNGYRGFSALQGSKERLFGEDRVVKRLTMEKYPDDSALKFIIELKQDAKVNVFDLKGPGRLIIDITPR